MSLRLTGIRHAYEGREVLRGVDLAVGPGEILCILGPSGDGRTTLLRLVLLSVRPTRGLVSLFGREVGGISKEALTGLRRRMGVVFQAYNLFPVIEIDAGRQLDIVLTGHVDLPLPNS